MVSGSFSLLCSRFFSPFLHSTALSVSREYLALRDGPRRFAPDFSCPGLLRCPFDFLRISLTGLSPSMATISIVFCYARSCLVWALPRSLATTCGIIVIFSSCGYLDVSVPRVCLPPCGIVIADWVAPFGDLRVTGYLRLSVTFRSLSRPSSPPRA